MFAFVVYAIAVWYAAAKWRRRWPSFAWVAAGFLGLVGVAWLHYRINIWTHGAIYLRVLQTMLYPYAVIVTIVGLYIACLPRKERLARSCTSCCYDLTGLAYSARCPECGTMSDGPPQRKLSPQEWFAPIPVNPDRAATTAQAAALPPAAPRWPGVAEPAACLRSEDQ